MIVNKQKGICFDLCVYSNVYIFMYTNYFLNRWFLIYCLILTIPEINFFKSKLFLILEALYIYYFIHIKYFILIFIPIKLNEISWQDFNHLILSFFEEWEIWSFVYYLFLPNTLSSNHNCKNEIFELFIISFLGL